MTKDQAIDKLRKCLELSKSSCVGEAEAAMAMANRLREQYQISAEDERKLTQLKWTPKESRPPKWMELFMGSVSNLYGVVATTRRAQRGGKYFCEVIFTGEDVDCEFAKMMYDYLCDTMTRAKKVAWYEKDPAKQVRGKKAVNDFAVGFAMEIGRRLKAMGDNASWGPQRPNKLEAAKAYMLQIYNGKQITTKKQKVTFGDDAAFRKGIVAGSNVGLNRQMDSSGATPNLSLGFMR
jgi:hypothetical protein